jgi:hypothetical protein
VSYDKSGSYVLAKDDSKSFIIAYDRSEGLP